MKDIPLGCSTTCRQESLKPLHVNPVRSRFRHLHVVHDLSNPLAKLSFRLAVALFGIACSLLSHVLHRITLGLLDRWLGREEMSSACAV